MTVYEKECFKKFYAQYSYVIPLEIDFILKTGRWKLFNLRKFGVIIIFLKATSHINYLYGIYNMEEKMSLSKITMKFVSFFMKKRKK